MAKFDKTVLVSVNTVRERDDLIKKIYTNLTKEPSLQFIVAKDQVNRIQVYHNAGQGRRILIRTYLVIVVPLIMDLDKLFCVTGMVEFHLDETIRLLENQVARLRKMQGTRLVKGTANGATFEQLVRSLCETNGKY